MKRKDMSPEEIKQRRIHMRRKFKACVYLVMANLFWLEDVGDEELGEDVKKNVQLLLKKKKDKISLLTLYDKTILCKAAEDRTPEEKNHLFKIIGNLKCFRKYPTDVKMRLAAVCYFVYYPPGRIVVRQFREGHTLYFIMSGEVAVSITIFDPILNEHKTTVVGTMVAGQMFGEVSLLHDIPRTATITTITHCEMILLHKDDFNVVLKSTLQAVWDQILSAMARFRYFDGWDDVSMRECCIYSKMKTYRMGDVVFGSGSNTDTYVHFVLQGQCRCIEELPVIEQFIGGIKQYTLFDRDKYNAQMILKRMSRDRRRSSAPRRKSSAPAKKIKSAETINEEEEEVEEEEEQKRNQLKTDDLKKLLGIYQECEQEFEIPHYVKRIFMQVCLFTELACFGLGENMKHRKIVAATDMVECVLIPKFWIWTKNKGNIWTRVVHVLNRKIPNTEEVFRIFLENRRWGAAKRELVNSIARKPPCNSINYVPYSIRLFEDLDYGVKYS